MTTSMQKHKQEAVFLQLLNLRRKSDSDSDYYKEAAKAMQTSGTALSPQKRQPKATPHCEATRKQRSVGSL